MLTVISFIGFFHLMPCRPPQGVVLTVISLIGFSTPNALPLTAGGADGRTRTCTANSGLWILSPMRLPFRHIRLLGLRLKPYKNFAFPQGHGKKICARLP